MRILIYGSKGWIGSQFCDFLATKDIKPIHGLCRVDDTQAVEYEIVDVQPTHVVSFIGRTHGRYKGREYTTIDYLEQPGVLTENIRDNLFAPMSLALLCHQRGIHFTYLGTGCIFEYDGEIQRDSLNGLVGFKESDEPNFFGSSYSIVKGFTDRLIHTLPVLNLRIRMPITRSHHPRNFITKITQYAKICSIPNSMTVLEDFFPVWFDMLCRQTTGTFNCTNPGVISHNEILSLYKKYVDPDFTWENFTVEEQNAVLASKRSNNALDTQKLQCRYPEVPDIYTAVERVMQTFERVN